MNSDDQIMQRDSSTFATVVLVASFASTMAVAALVSVYVARRRRQHRRETGPHEGPEADVAGIEEQALERFPMLLYSQANKLRIGVNNYNGDTSNGGSSCCSVCLGDYRDCDLLRLLPGCGHAFHQKCVDSWLRLRAMCPLCRRLLLNDNNNNNDSNVVVVGGGGGGGGEA